MILSKQGCRKYFEDRNSSKHTKDPAATKFPN
jgi:hypothetical protein